MVDQIENENMDMDMLPDEADDTNVNDMDEKPFGIFNMINYVKTSIEEFVKEERGEFEADLHDATEETYGTCWEIDNDVLPPIQSIAFPQWSPQHPHPRPPKEINEFESIRSSERSRDQRKAGGTRDSRKEGGMSLLKRLLSAPERGPRVLKKKEHKGISSFSVVMNDDGPKMPVRYDKNTGIGNRHKWARRGKMRLSLSKP